MKQLSDITRPGIPEQCQEEIWVRLTAITPRIHEQENIVLSLSERGNLYSSRANSCDEVVLQLSVKDGLIDVRIGRKNQPHIGLHARARSQSNGDGLAIEYLEQESLEFEG